MEPAKYLAMHYSPVLVLLSWAVAFFAAYSALSTVNRLREGNRSLVWLGSGAVSFGLGVWAMHFVGMAALQLGIPVRYDPLITSSSVLFSIIGGALAFSIVGRPKVSTGNILLGGLLLGAGIGGMHYVGMFAMRMDAKLSFDPVLFLTSVGVAVSISSVGLWLMTTPLLQGFAARNLLIAAVVGAAIPLMHYAGMAAARFSETNKTDSFGMHVHDGSSSYMLINAAVVLAIAIMAMPLFAASLVQTRSELAQEVEP